MSKSVRIAKTLIFSNLNYLYILSFGLGKYNLVLLILIENTAIKTIFLSLSFPLCYSSLFIPGLAQPTLSCWSLPKCFLLWKALVACLQLVCHFHSLLRSNSRCQVSQPTCNTFNKVLLCILLAAFFFYKDPIYSPTVTDIFSSKLFLKLLFPVMSTI